MSSNIPTPPRLTGNAATDVQILQDYLWQFYKALDLELDVSGSLSGLSENQDGTTTEVGTLGERLAALETFESSNPHCVQRVRTEYSAVDSTAVLIPYDDTIPQSTEGKAFMTATITPKAATNKLKVTVTGHYGVGNAAVVTQAIFRDANTDASAATGQSTAASSMGTITNSYEVVAGSTAATTFTVNAGPSAASTVTFNGTGAVRRYGGITISSITIEEYQPGT